MRFNRTPFYWHNIAKIGKVWRQRDSAEEDGLITIYNYEYIKAAGC
jgi:hypothetical protein